MLEINKIHHGDCLDLMQDIPDKSIDMILCDLPYGTTACKWDTIIPFEPLWEQYNRVIKDKGAIVLTASQPFTTKLINSNFNNLKHLWYWNKENGGNFAITKYMPHKVIEDILVFSRDGERVNYYPIMEEIEKEKIRPIREPRSGGRRSTHGVRNLKASIGYSNEKRYPKNLLTYNSRAGELNSSNRLHPTQKPVALYEYLIKTYTQTGGVVLDNCIGSGTTAIAATNTCRQFIGIEQEKKYVDIANNRIKKHTDKLALIELDVGDNHVRN